MTNALKETLTMLIATTALVAILMSAARAEEPSIDAAQIDQQIAAMTANVGDQLFAVNSAALPAPKEFEFPARDFAENDRDVAPLRFVSAERRRVNLISLSPARISLVD